MDTRFFESDGGRISYEQLGSGPLVVCVPGLGDLRSEYRFLAPELAAAGFRVVSMDLRGHGESSTSWEDYSVAGVGRDILALIRRLQSGPAVVVGTSMGAGAAVWAAAEASELVSGLILIGPSVHGEVSRRNRLLYSLLFSRPWGPALWKSYYLSLYPTRKPADIEAYTRTLAANLRQPGRLECMRAMILASKAASEERLPRVKAPALVLMGSKDPDFEPESEARFVAGRLNGRYQMIDGAGHYPHVEMPGETTPFVLNFLAEVNHVAQIRVG